MPVNIQMRDGLVESFFHGDIGTDDFQEMAEFYRDVEARLEVTPDRIADLSGANFMSLDADILRRFAAGRARMPLKNRVKSAIIAPQPEQFGLARMFQTYNENPLIETKLFRDGVSAYEWLGRAARPA
ncbi:MAG: hypothetical protein P4N60_12970 [Verrucomicrobiae bacterium]|nr:hypothetical protein [Verrucomicrobiae bacterium]